jgi:hypothetical protein
MARDEGVLKPPRKAIPDRAVRRGLPDTDILTALLAKAEAARP